MRKIFLLLLPTSIIFGTDFKFKFNESYRIESTVYQNVYSNNHLELSSIILNKYSVNVKENIKDGALLDITHDVFQESRGLTSGFYTKEESETGEVEQNEFGKITSLTNPNFPLVQSIPVFPDRELFPGDSWTSMATEYFNLKNGFNIDEIISAQFRVFYTYEGDRDINGVNVAIIKVNYNIYEKIQPYIDWGVFYPEKINAGSKQTIYWDINKGRVHSVEDNFFLDFSIPTGDKFTFKGTTESKSWPKNNLNSDRMQELVAKIEQNPKAHVVENDESLKITFNSMLFEAESSQLREEVKQYLDTIGKAFSEMNDVNIKITGHTAIFGQSDKTYLKVLSINRAKSVAKYLIYIGAIDRDGIEIIGMGGDQPVADNGTKEGRSLNRRVEIDILKN